MSRLIDADELKKDDEVTMWLSKDPVRTGKQLKMFSEYFINKIDNMPTVQAVPVIRCKDCKYFEYDRVANVDGIPLIVAHEICSKWSDGCKTSEEGYCFLAEKRGDDNGTD